MVRIVKSRGSAHSYCLTVDMDLVVRLGCVMGQQIRAESPASCARGDGLAGGCQVRVGLVVGCGWSTSQLVVPVPILIFFE